VSGEKAFQWTVSLVLFGVLFLGVSDTQLVAPLLPLIARDFQITPGSAGMIVTTYSLAAAAFAILIGPLSDRVGRKKVLAFGIASFITASFLTYTVTSFTALLIVRMLTGLSAGTLSTCSLSYAADHYSYAQRGRAMGVLSMAYFAAFVVGVPAGAIVAKRLGWHYVFAGFAVFAIGMLAAIFIFLPDDSHRTRSPYSLDSLRQHFYKRDRLAGMIAAFLTSGGIVGFLTYVGAWLATEQGIGVDRIALLFMAAGLAAVAASPIGGWCSDRAGKRNVIIWSNIVLAILFVVVARLDWGVTLIIGIGVLSIAASVRQAPLHALTTELVGTEIRGEYIAIRNAASQLGIATVATASATAFDVGGFAAVSYLAGFATLLVPACCIWLKEPVVGPALRKG
jgi:predicted MFS family arabinose efflux permease